MKNRTKAISIASILLFLILALCLIFYFTRPLVYFVSSEELSEFNKDFQSPRFVSFSYRSMKINKSELYTLDEKRKPALIILDPFVQYSTDVVSARIFSEKMDEDDISFDIDIMKEFVSLSGKDDFVYLYRKGNSLDEGILDHLERNLDNRIYAISYNERISGVNLDEIKEEISSTGVKRVLLPDPQSALRILDEDYSFFVDVRDKVAFKDKRNVKSVSIDWDGAIKKALDEKSGNISLDFAL